MQKTLDYLRELKINNSKDWFLDHMKEYEEVRTELNDLAFLVLEQLALFDPLLNDEVDVSRFISNLVIIKPKKSDPYHTHFSISISPLANDGNEPLYDIHIDPEQSYISIKYDPDIFGIQVMRNFITKNADQFRELLEDTFSDGFELNESSVLSALPKGYQPGVPAEQFIKLQRYEIRCLVDLLKEQQELLKDITASFRAVLPLLNFMRRGLGLA